MPATLPRGSEAQKPSPTASKTQVFSDFTLTQILVGLPVLGLGLWLMGLVILDFVKSGDFILEELWGRGFVFVLGTFFALLGYRLAGSWQRVALDMNRRTWRAVEWGFFSRKVARGAFEDFKEVTFRRRVYSSRNSKHALFHVDIKMQSGAKRSKFQLLKIDALKDFIKARQLAERMARLLQIPLRDYTVLGKSTQVLFNFPVEVKEEEAGEEGQLLASDHLDRNLHSGNSRNSNGGLAVPEPGLKLTRVKRVNGKLHLTLPMERWRDVRVGVYVLIFLALSFSGFMGLVILPDFPERDQTLSTYLAIHSLSLFLILSALGQVGKTLLGKEIISLSSREISLIRHYGLFKLSRELDAQSVEDISLRLLDEEDSEAITVRNDENLLSFGRSLPSKEKKWLVHLIHTELTG